MKLCAKFSTVVLLVASVAHAAGPADALLAAARQRLESTDSRATGRLVRVEPNGKRTSQSFAIRAHWFPGVLRVLLEITPSATPEAATAETQAGAQKPGPDTRMSLLFEMRPGGQSTVMLFRPQATAPTPVPFARWGEAVAGSDFDYEDFLQPELYWQGQTALPGETVGDRTCDVLKSVPDASDRSHYASVETCFDRATGYPLHVQKTLKNAGTMKEFTSLGLTQSSGVWAARQVEVKVRGRSGSTLLLFERGTAKAHLGLKDFTPEQIRRFENHP